MGNTCDLGGELVEEEGGSDCLDAAISKLVDLGMKTNFLALSSILLVSKGYVKVVSIFLGFSICPLAWNSDPLKSVSYSQIFSYPMKSNSIKLMELNMKKKEIHNNYMLECFQNEYDP